MEKYLEQKLNTCWFNFFIDFLKIQFKYFLKLEAVKYRVRSFVENT